MAAITPDGKAKVPKQPKRIRLPPDPSSTLLQGIYLTVPGYGSGHKLLPAKFTSGSLPHDISYRMDASIKAKSRSQSPVRVRLAGLSTLSYCTTLLCWLGALSVLTQQHVSHAGIARGMRLLQRLPYDRGSDADCCCRASWARWSSTMKWKTRPPGT